jgi:uncharacterized protein involved in exopolysaccharide biosynthesis
MTTTNGTHSTGFGSLSFSARDFIAIGFRHKRGIALTFCAVLLGAILAAVMQPPKYRASTKFLLQHERMDPVVSPDRDPRVIRSEVSEEEMNSEVELLQSEDVLREVVLAAGLQQQDMSLRHRILGHFLKEDEQTRIAKAVVRLRNELDIEPIRKSNIIKVTYASSDPRLAVRVLAAIDDSYVKKSLAVHHPPGAVQFFDEETERYKKNLADAEDRLKSFSEEEGGVSPQLARDITLQKLNEFNATLQQTNAEMAATTERISQLERQSTTTPQRLTTQARAIDDAQVLQGLKTTLMNLELKRTELLTKYQPGYPLVQEVDKQIAETRAAIAREESKPLREETTDQNPTYAWIGAELAKAKADYSGLQARAAAMKGIVATYQAKAHELEQKGILQQDLLRDVKAQEESYLLYQRKREEAQMSDALDRTRIVNVLIAELPAVPTLPSNSPWTTLALGIVVATALSGAMAFILEYADPSLRTPAEVFSELNIPVLAAVPQQVSRRCVNENGNGNRKGHGTGNADHSSDDAVAVSTGGRGH